MIKGHPVQVTPDHGPPGTVVHLEGSGFVENYWKELNGWDTPGGHREYFGLERADGDCELIVRDDYVSSSVSASGRLSAAFRVGQTGSCFQQLSGPKAVTPGVYTIQLTCHACGVAEFRVTNP